jgi:hypothetical protein
MLVNLRGVYHYCELPPATFDACMAAPSMGQFYKQNIKGSGLDGPFDCRTYRVPSYCCAAIRQLVEIRLKAKK